MARRARPQTTPEDGARSVMNVVLSDEDWSGRYFHELQPGTAHPQAYEEEARTRLRRLRRGGPAWAREYAEATGAARP